MSDKNNFPEDPNYEAPLAIASLVGSLMQLKLVAEGNRSKEPFAPQHVFLPVAEKQKQPLIKILKSLISGLIAMTEMPTEVVDDLKKECGETAVQRLADRGDIDTSDMEALIREAIDGSVDKCEEVVYNEDDLSWMDKHPRFRKN